MSRFRRTALLALTLAVATVLPAAAATETFTIDQTHSQVMFNIRHLVSLFNGRFNDVKGTIVLDREDLATAKITAEVEVASIDTANSSRDDKLRSADYFDTATYPVASFRSTAVVPKEKGKATVKGMLTMHGVTKPVELDAEIFGFEPDGRGGVRGGFLGRTEVLRSDFGIAWDDSQPGAKLALGNEVEIILQIEAIREEPEKDGASKGVE